VWLIPVWSSFIANIQGILTGAASPAPNPTPSPTTRFNVNDIVQFGGGGVYRSSTASTPAHSRGRSRCRVTQINARGRNPLHLVSTDGGNVHGWVVGGDVSAINTAPPVTEPITALKPIDTIAREVIRGLWGNGQDRVRRLTAAGYNASQVQARVNQLM
jgi:hypothetical protein